MDELLIKDHTSLKYFESTGIIEVTTINEGTKELDTKDNGLTIHFYDNININPNGKILNYGSGLTFNKASLEFNSKDNLLNIGFSKLENKMMLKVIGEDTIRDGFESHNMFYIGAGNGNPGNPDLSKVFIHTDINNNIITIKKQ